MEFKSRKAALSGISKNSKAIKKPKYNVWPDRSPHLQYSNKFASKSKLSFTFSSPKVQRNVFKGSPYSRTHSPKLLSNNSNKVSSNESNQEFRFSPKSATSTQMNLYSPPSVKNERRMSNSPLNSKILKPSSSENISLNKRETFKPIKLDQYDIDSIDDEEDVILSSNYDFSKQKENSKININLFKINNDKENISQLNLFSSPLKSNYISSDFDDTLDIEPNMFKLENEVLRRIGFPNHGNTCYINAVLQSIICLEPFMKDLIETCTRTFTNNTTPPSLTKCLCDIVSARKQSNLDSVDSALHNVKKIIEEANSLFFGSKMHDASEFLTMVLDMLKEELDKLGTRESNELKPNLSKNGESVPNRGVSAQHEKESSSLFYTPDSCSPLSPVLKEKNEIDVGNARNSPISSTSSQETFIGPIRANFSTGNAISPKDSSIETSAFPNRKTIIEPKNSPIKCNNSLPSTSISVTESSLNCSLFVNPIPKYFEFELLESYSCLRCGTAEGRIQKHYALYVDLPTTDATDPSIFEAINSYMRGEKREKKCDNCENNDSLFLPRFNRIPRILIVNLKRFNFNSQEMLSAKIASKINFDLKLQLKAFVSKSSLSPSSYFGQGESNNREKNEEGLESSNEKDAMGFVDSPTDHSKGFTDGEMPDTVFSDDEFAYSLVSIVSHLGSSTTGGHYVSDIFDYEESQWLHCNDESIRQVSSSELTGESRQMNGYIFIYIHNSLFKRDIDNKKNHS